MIGHPVCRGTTWMDSARASVSGIRALAGKLTDSWWERPLGPVEGLLGKEDAEGVLCLRASD